MLLLATLLLSPREASCDCSSTLSQEGPAPVLFLPLSILLYFFLFIPLIPLLPFLPPVTIPHLVLSIFTPPQLPACPLPSLSVPARRGRFLGVQTRSSHGNHGPSAVSSHSPPSSARCWRWRARMNDGLPPNGNNVNQKKKPDIYQPHLMCMTG